MVGDGGVDGVAVGRRVSGVVGLLLQGLRRAREWMRLVTFGKGGRDLAGSEGEEVNLCMRQTIHHIRWKKDLHSM